MEGQPEPTTEELRLTQARRAESEHTAAGTAQDPDEAAVHDRRAEKADYLRARLAEREEAEQADERT